MKCYKFRLKPTKLQINALENYLNLCRFSYNKYLEELNNSESRNMVEIQSKTAELRKMFPELNALYSSSMRYECWKLFKNLRQLGLMKKKGYKVGALRFKGKDWFKTFHYNASGFKLIPTNNRHSKLRLSRIGEILIRCHRITKGKIKHVMIKREVDRWFAILITDEEYKTKCGNGVVGQDFGLINFISDSNGTKIKAPLFYKKSLRKIKLAQQNLSRKKLKSNNRRKARIFLAKRHDKVKRQRHDFLQKLSTETVRKNKFIVIEDLKIRNLTRNRSGLFNKANFFDCAWYKYVRMVECKAESASGQLIRVNPKNTSKKCSSCGAMHDLSLKQRIYRCECGLELDRDVNAARNILAQGLRFVEKTPLPEKAWVSVKQEANSIGNPPLSVNSN